MATSVLTGSVAATGVAINLSIGFVPEYVKVINVTDGLVIYEWFNTMADGTAIRTDLAVGPQAANGISKYLGTSALAPGFTLGTAIALAGKTLAWLASRDSTS